VSRAWWIARAVLLPALLIAAGFLAWWTIRTARDLQRLDKASIIEGTLLLAREKVDRAELQLSAAELAVIHLVNPDDLDPLALRWSETAERLSPSVRSVLVLDERLRVVRHVVRADAAERPEFITVFERSISPLLELSSLSVDAQRRLHRVVDTRSVFVSAVAREVVGRRHYVIIEHDIDYIRNTLLPALFEDPAERGRFNVVDEDGHLIVGRRLSGGDFVVSLRFGNSLDRWRLSAEPRSVQEIEARARRRPVVSLVLVALSLVVLLAGVLFLAFAARHEQRLNALKSDFIATVSHELKTPLSLIRMFSDMLTSDREVPEDRKKQYLQIISRESERLTALIENVLDFARVERGKAAYEFTRSNLRDVVVKGVELFRSRVDRERPAIVVELSEPIPDSDLDEQAVQLLLFNLLDNAVKYAPEGDKITVRVKHEGARLSLEVQDDGPGIDEDDQRRVFERFYRGRRAREHGARGSGIGLALVQHIARSHGGDVAVRNGEPKGAVFTVAIPVRLS
jgi:two-component system phosphate regulon sensor histidine kinase PhoR